MGVDWSKQAANHLHQCFPRTCFDLNLGTQSTLSNSNSLGDRKNVPIIKSLNYMSSNYRSFLLGDF